MALIGCAPQAGQLPPDTLVRINDSEVRSLDPQKVADLSSLRVATDQFVGLTRIGAHGDPEPALARRWVISPDGLVWTFYWAGDAHYSDGSPLRPDAIAQSFARLRNPKTAAQAKTLFDPIAAVTATTDRVVVTLRAPFPHLPALMAHPAMAALPHHRIAAAGDAWVDDRPLVTSGPYHTTRWQLNDALDLRRSTSWRDPRDRNAPAKVQWRGMEDALAALRLYQGGGADIINDIPPTRLATLREDYGDRLRSTPYNGTYYFAFNTRQPPFDNVMVRRALTSSINRQWIVTSIIGGRASVAERFVPAWLSGTAPPTMAQSDGVDYAAARALLAKAGYGPDRPLRFAVRFNSGAENRRIATALAEMWRPLGVEVALLNAESALHFAVLKRADFALAKASWVADLPAPENFLSILSGDGPSNYSGYHSVAFNAALATALDQADPVARQVAMRRAEDIMLADAPIIPLYHYGTRTLISARVRGFVDNAANAHPSFGLSLDTGR